MLFPKIVIAQMSYIQNNVGFKFNKHTSNSIRILLELKYVIVIHIGQMRPDNYNSQLYTLGRSWLMLDPYETMVETGEQVSSKQICRKDK